MPTLEPGPGLRTRFLLRVGPSTCAVSILLCTLLVLLFTESAKPQLAGREGDQTPQKVSVKENATDQLRAIADAIKKCPQSVSPGPYGEDVISAPLNTTWHVEERASAGEKKVGIIDFVLNTSYIPSDTERCGKRDSACAFRNEVANGMTAAMSNVHPLDQFRYEFDFGSQGLEFARALAKHQPEDETHWVATELSGCDGDAVLMTLSSPPPAIPEELWRGAKQGDPYAMLRLGAFYESQKNVPNNMDKALHWYYRAADEGNSEAAFFLGAIYLDGKGVARDYSIAMTWLHKSAEQSNADAEFTLGYAYYHGEGVAENTSEALFWLTLAANQSSLKDAAEGARPLLNEIGSKMSGSKRREVQKQVSEWMESQAVSSY